MLFPSFFNAGKPTYEIEQSLRFDGTADLVLTTPATTESINAFTMSCWVKVLHGSDQTQFMGRKGAPNNVNNVWLNHNALGGQGIGSYMYTASINGRGVLNTNAKYRDYSAWMHVHYSVDSSVGNTQKLYVNGVDVTANTDTISGVLTFDFSSTYPFQIGNASSSKFYLAEYHFISGSRPDYTNFGEEDANGVWRPKRYTGSYGTNGFYLKFDPTATNGIGHDHSGTGNHLTATGFTTSGTGTDVMSDTPTTNWCTLNPLDKNTSASAPSDGNLSWNQSSAAWWAIRGTIGVTSGKWYWETKLDSGLYGAIGIGNSRADLDGYSAESNVWSYVNNGRLEANGTGSVWGNTYTTNDVIGVALDADTGKLWFSKNGTWQESGNPSAGTSPAVSGLATDSYFPYFVHYQTTISTNFGQREFANPPGTVGATTAFNTVLYTGNSSTNAITGVGFQADLVWIKSRSHGSNHALYDAIRGTNKELRCDTTNSEFTFTDSLNSFDSNGFTLGSDTGNGNVNLSGRTYVAWCFNAGTGSPVTNNDGTITSTVKASPDNGFSVVSYTGTGNAATVGHGLGVAPSLIIEKNRDLNQNWVVYHSALGATKALILDDNFGQQTATYYWNDTAPTSDVFSIGTWNGVNSNTQKHIAYCFAEKPGVSKFGEYTGNGSSDGPVISCGFRPAMVMIKWYEGVNTAESWQMYDNKRAGNPTNTILQPDSAGVEESPSDRYIQFTADGFQLKSNGQQINRSGAKYIFMAWAATFTGSDDFKSLNTANLPAPTVKDGSKNFDTLLYTGNGSYPRAVTGVGFSPDLVWLKSRTNDYGHGIYDRVRGVGTSATSLRIDSTSEEGGAPIAPYIDMDSLDSDGFTLGNTVSAFEIFNENNKNFVAWTWKADNTSGSTNTAGSITSTVSANPTAGFSIVSYTGNGTSGATWGHGLGIAPKMVIFKNRDDGGVNANWTVYNESIGLANNLYLNKPDGNSAASIFWDTAPSSTVFTVKNHINVNSLNNKYVAYCFADVEGYSKFGSYVGNGSPTDGPFVSLSFAPALIIIKKSNAAANWVIMDKERYTYNPRTQVLYPSDPSPEVSLSGVADIDFLSNGFKIRRSWDNINALNGTYVYMALAENPFGGSGVSPATAR